MLTVNIGGEKEFQDEPKFAIRQPGEPGAEMLIARISVRRGTPVRAAVNDAEMQGYAAISDKESRW
jgi:hypothetical protein